METKKLDNTMPPSILTIQKARRRCNYCLADLSNIKEEELAKFCYSEMYDGQEFVCCTNCAQQINRSEAPPYGFDKIEQLSKLSLLPAKPIENQQEAVSAEIVEMTTKIKDLCKDGYPYVQYTEQQMVDDFMVLKGTTAADLIQGKKILKKRSNGGKVCLHYAKSRFSSTKKGKSSIAIACENERFISRLAARLVNKKNMKPNEVAASTVRNYMEGISGVACVYNFAPVVARTITELLLPNGGIVYDFSAGFGGRMVGVTSLGPKYIYYGIEPREQGIKELQQIGEFVNRHDSCAIVRQGSSELYCPEEQKEMFDLTISSPPYFDTEIYSDEETQCYIRYPDYNDWLEHYWRKTIQNVHKLTKKEGLLALNIGGKFVDDMVQIVIQEHFEEVDRYEMGISHSQKQRKNRSYLPYEPIVIFKKK